jgi:glycerophosphoryl diester phosphodiesterase
VGRIQPIIVAHRGLHTQLPENSIAAMVAAWDAGILWCECDVQLSGDGIPMVIHDETLERTTTGRGNVADFTARELRELPLLGEDGKPTPHLLPTLDELLELCGPDRKLLVETKPLLGEKMESIARHVHAKGGMIHTFHLGDLFAAHRATGNACSVALLVEKDQEIPGVFGGPFHVHYERIQHGNGLKTVGVWTVNDPEEIRRILKFDVSMIITDFPLEARRIVDEQACSPR